MHLKNGKKMYNERGITFFHETERYVNDLNIYNRSKNGTNLWDDLIVSDKEEIESSTSSGVDYYTESASIFIIPVKYRAVTHRVIAATRTTCTRWLYLRDESKGLGLIVRIIK